MKLSKNFYLNEFTVSAGMNIIATKEQIFCLKILCRDVLQRIRNKFGTVVITSGLRNMESYRKLKAQGYPASLTSDHFGWSDANPRGTGAADIHCPNADILDVFHFVQEYLYDEIGQVIYYPGKNIVHVSNRFNKIFTMPDSREESRRVMIYQNGKFSPYPRRKLSVCGKTFKIWPFK